MPTLDIGHAANANMGNVNFEDSGFNTLAAFGTAWLGDDGDQQHEWIRFPNVTIPQGAVITVAYVTLSGVTVPSNSGTILSNIFGVDEDDHAAPTSFATWSTDHGLHTTATVVWDFATGAGSTRQTPSLVSIIQEIVDRGGWSSGNAIGIHLDNDGTAEDVILSATGATLHIEWADTLDRDIGSTADMGYAFPETSFVEAIATSGFTLVGSGDFVGDFPIHTWIRFPNITLHPGSTIVSAYMVLTIDNEENQGTSVLSNIYGIDEDDHAAPTTFAAWNTDHGLHTTAVVTWDFSVSGAGTQQTSDITSIIQEIIDRGGWASGNDIGVHIDDDGSANGLQGWNSASLHIDYIPPAEIPIDGDPDNLVATPFSHNRIDLAWDDNASNETGYRVERSDDGSTGWTDVSGSLPANSTSYSDTGLTPETEYFYRVFAFNGAGDSDPSNTDSATTEEAPEAAANDLYLRAFTDKDGVVNPGDLELRSQASKSTPEAEELDFTAQEAEESDSASSPSLTTEPVLTAELATETDSPVAASLAVELAFIAELASELDAASSASLAPSSAFPADLATEVDSASSPTLIIEPVITAELAQNLEISYPVSLSVEPALDAELATEIDQANNPSLALEPVFVVETATEIDSASDATFAPAKSLTAEQATEIDQAYEPALSTELVFIAELATEIDTAIEPVLAFAPLFAADLATEIDSAATPSIAVEPVFLAELATELDTASDVDLTSVSGLSAGLALELDVAYPASLTTPLLYNAEPATETDSAYEPTLTTEPVFNAGLATETDQATDVVVGPVVGIAAEQAVELDSASSPTLATEPAFDLLSASEIDQAFEAILATDPAFYAELATELDAAFAADLATTAIEEPVFTAALATEIDEAFDAVLAAEPALTVALSVEWDYAYAVLLGESGPAIDDLEGQRSFSTTSRTADDDDRLYDTTDRTYKTVGRSYR